MLPARTLTFEFEQVVLAPGQTPEEYEIVLVPLNSPLEGTVPDATLVGNRQSQTFLYPGPVHFEVVPSDSPGLATTVWYRVGWRPRFFGRLEIADFTMPDEDLTFDDLKNLGKVIGNSIYLRQADLGVHVAALDAEGFVLDGNGDRVGADTTMAMSAIAEERQQRTLADASLRTNLQAQISDQVAATLSTATARINAAVSTLQSTDLTEQGARIAAVNTLNATIAAIQTTLTADLAELSDTVDAHTALLPTKADLVDGRLVTSQLPTLSLTTAVPVAGQTEMLALTSSQVQPGDLAVRPDGSWLLLTTPISNIDSWIKLSTGGGVQAINGQEGIVVLGPADVGAIAIGASIAQSQVTGLVAALITKADATTVTGINTRLSTIENDTTIVRTVSSLIAKALMPADTVFADSDGLLRRKNGDLLPGGGGGGGPVDWTQVLNKPSTFAPSAHAANHAAGGSDPLTLTTAQVTGLTSTLTSYGSRINTLESAPPGSGGGSPAKSLWFDGPPITGITNLADFQADLVLQKSPFGQASDNSYYYNPAGADNDEWRWPVLTPNGHLKLTKWDETAPADPVMATAASVTAVSDAVALKADASALTALSGTVATKADGSVVSALATTVGTKADSSTVASLQTQANTTDAVVATKADAADLTALTTVVGTKTTLAAVQTDLADDFAAITTALGGKEPTIPSGTTSQYIRGNKTLATLDRTALGLANVDNTSDVNKPISSATQTALNGKADVVGGKIPTSQLPALATNETQVVANKAAMLALTTLQVQVGDICVITATIDKGSYILSSADPSVEANWVKLTTSDAPVTGIFSAVSGTFLIGDVTLTAADVGARNATTLIGSSDLSTALTNIINGKAATTYVDAGLAGKTSTTDVQTQIDAAALTKITVNVVATTNISLSGTPSIDGVATSNGMRVLATAQTSSVNNGLYIVAAGTWLRATDMAGPNPSGTGPAGNFFVKGTWVIATTGTANANTLWAQTSASGIVGTAANNWIKALTAGPPLVYAAAANSGLTITGTDIVVKNTTGISVTTAGVGVDHTKVPWIAKGTVPAGSANAVVTHNLGTKDIASVTIYDFTTYAIAGLVGWTCTSVDTITLEFADAPTTNQFRYVILG